MKEQKPPVRRGTRPLEKFFTGMALHEGREVVRLNYIDDSGENICSDVAVTACDEEQIMGFCNYRGKDYKFRRDQIDGPMMILSTHQMVDPKISGLCR